MAGPIGGWIVRTACTALWGAVRGWLRADGAGGPPSGHWRRFKRVSKGLWCRVAPPGGADLPESGDRGYCRAAQAPTVALAHPSLSGQQPQADLRPSLARQSLARANPTPAAPPPKLAGMRSRRHSVSKRLAVGLALAVCAGAASGCVAVAPCLFQVPQGGAADQLVEVQVTPAGDFRPRDGRELPVSHWHIDAASAARVIAEFRTLKTPPVIDYEHQTLLAEENGQPAPAAGFIRDLEWREGQGLFAKIELTPRARQYVADGEYRYFSPVLVYDKTTGEIRRLLMGALTNNPALDGMAPIELRAAARFNLTEEPATMNKHLLAIATALALATANKTEDQLGAEVLTAVTNLQGTTDLAALRKELGLNDDVGMEEISTAVAALKSKANSAATTGEPDPAEFVPVGVVKELRDQVAALSAQNLQREVDDLVKPALEDGRLLAAQEKWARDLGKSNLAALKTYLDEAEPIAALRGSQTDGRAPAGGKDENGLTPDEIAVCKATGIEPKDFAAQKAAATATA